MSQPTVLPITERALRLAQTYARLAPGHEIFGFLLGEPGSEVVTDVLLAPAQQVTPTSVFVDPVAVLAAGATIRARGKVALGVFHSHAQAAPFHSGTDDANALELVSQLAPVNARDRVETFEPVVDGSRVVFRRGGETLELDHDGILIVGKEAIGSIRLTRRSSYGFAYSLVVNARDDPPYAEAYVKSWCSACGGEVVSNRGVQVEVVDAVDESAMQEELRASIVPRERDLAPIGALAGYFSGRRNGR